jgi:hypothetical protein
LYLRYLLFVIFSERIVKASFSDTLSLSSANTTGGMFNTGMLYQQDSFLENTFMPSKGSGKSKLDDYDTVSLRSQEETIR